MLQRSGELILAERLLEHDGVWPPGTGQGDIAANEDVGNEPVPKYLIHGGDATAVVQQNIDNHHVGLAQLSGGNRASLGHFDSADCITHVLEHTGKHRGDHDIIINDKNAKLCHRILHQ